MANPILKDDLISQEALDALERMSKLLHDDALAMEAMIKTTGQYAGSLGSMIQQQQQDNAALQTYADRIENLENALAKMQKMMAENKATQAALNAEKRKYAKLTDEEANNVRSLAQGMNAYVDLIKKGNKVTLQNKELVDIQNKSYNELYQTYNALKDALNRMTTEERLNTEVGKTMTAQALKIRDTMNELQKSTGNYTLQVGKYRAAFDGLGYSFQQILREVPSALNIQQFFLAISNNIPLFMDQLEGYKKKQQEIAESLKIMEDEGKTATEEYKKLATNVESWGKHLLKSLVSWQTAIIAVTFILRMYGAKIIDWFKNLFKKAEETLSLLWKFRALINEIDIKVFEATSKAVVELDEINKRIADATKGTEEWRNMVLRVNEITGSTLDILTATPAEIQKVTKAYIAQAEQLAKNQFVIQKISESADNAFKKERAYKSKSVNEMASALGIATDSKDYEKLEDLYNSYIKKQEAYQEKYRKRIATYRDKHRLYQAKEDLKAFVEEIAPTRSQAELEALWDKYYKAMPIKNTINGSGKGVHEQDMADQYWEAEEALIKMRKVGYQQEIALAGIYHDKSVQEQINTNERMQQAVKENVENGFITKEEGARRLQELEMQNDAILLDIDEKYQKEINSINTKYAEMDRQVVIEEEKNKIEELDELYKVQENNRKRRIRTIKEEELSNLRIVESIQKMQDEIAALNALNLTQPEAIEQRTKRIEELGKAIEKMRQQIEYTKQLSNYSSIGDIFKRNGAFNVSGNMKTSILGSILGEDVVGKMSGDQIEGAFDTWLDNAGKSISTWYNTTMGYINDLIGAYVDLANAKAEAAKEATEAAQEEYEKEKALLESGYASRVEATWAEYQEKKAAQEQAEKDAKAAAEAQQQLNEISTLGSLVTASANIWKTFTEIPVVGVPLAIAAIGTMFGSFLAAKMKAAQVSQYGEGGFEVLEGGSHASGHDIDLGVNNRRGRRMHAEGKEGLAIFSRRAMNHYGTDGIENMVNGINHLEYEQSVGRTLSLQRDMGLHNTMILPRTNLHKVESSLDKLVSYGSSSRYYDPDGTEVITTASGTTRIRRR